MSKKEKGTGTFKQTWVLLGADEKVKEMDSNLLYLRNRFIELKELLKGLQQVSDSFSDDGQTRDKKIIELESAQKMFKDNLGTYEENLKEVTKLLKEVKVEQQQLKEDQAKLRSESTKDAKEFKAQVGSLTTSICTTKKELQQEQQLLANTLVANQENQEKIAEKNLQTIEMMRIIHIEKRDEEKKRDEEVESLKIQLKELKPKSNCDCKGIEKQVATLTASVNSIQLKTNDLLATNQENRESAEAVNPQVHQLHTSPPIQEICNELQQRENKQQNLVVFGLPESNGDAEEIQQLISDIGAFSTVNSSFRVGKGTEGRARPLVIRFLSKHERNEVYSKLKNLKGQEKWNKISVSPDLTKMQCMEEKQLFDILSKQAKEKNEASDARDGLWKVIGRRGNKRLVLTK